MIGQLEDVYMYVSLYACLDMLESPFYFRFWLFGFDVFCLFSTWVSGVSEAAKKRKKE